MVIGIFGESCTGKPTIAENLKDKLAATIFSGKDYLRLAKNEAEAKNQFTTMLTEHTQKDENIIYVFSEKEYLPLLPQGAIRVLVTADIELIKERFAKRMSGNLPVPVATMLEKKHGMFDNESCDIHINNSENSLDDICSDIIKHCIK